MPELRGNLSGIKDSVQREMVQLYDFPVGADEFLPYELGQALCRFTAQTRRRSRCIFAGAGAGYRRRAEGQCAAGRFGPAPQRKALKPRPLHPYPSFRPVHAV